jgi:DNA invertase Pin-like site-specific DNA recombinase
VNTISERTVFYNLINNELKENDLLLVTKIDRCSRNTLEFLKLQEKLFHKSVTFISLDLPYSKDMAVNKIMVNKTIKKLWKKKNFQPIKAIQ